MFTVRVEAEFAAAHFLSHYHGKCENLHGHNYMVRLLAKGTDLDEGGMLADFSQLKKVIRAISAQLDHTNLNDMPVFMNDPSAERIAKYIFDEAEKLLLSMNIDPEKLHAIEVFETPTSMARYER
jgi:6-pyruvoyltetrahydropterin/6-carboxytetrahydropterin synthase